MNLDEYKSIGTHCIVLFVNRKNVTYFDSKEEIKILQQIFIEHKQMIR